MYLTAMVLGKGSESLPFFRNGKELYVGETQTETYTQSQMFVKAALKFKLPWAKVFSVLRAL